MAIELVSVQFGIAGNPANPIAPMSLDRGEHPSAEVEWRRGSEEPEDSPIIILRDLLPSDGVVVTPIFRRTGGETAVTFSVTCEFLSHGPGPLPKLGGLSGIRLPFDPRSDTTEPEQMVLEGTEVETVGRFDATLTWTMSPDGGRREDTQHQKTRHAVYVILGAPTTPWSAAPEDESLWLWPEVLDIACEWACGAKTFDGAAELITTNVFLLGSKPENAGGLRYNKAGTAYTRADYFQLNDFLDHYSGKVPRALVDCRDLASIVSTFSNALGCRLIQSQCGNGDLTAAVNLIGGPSDAPTRFGFHELSWEGGSSLENRVWDACVGLAGAPMIARQFKDYAQDVYSAPCAKPTGPAYTSNRPFRPRSGVRTLTSKTEKAAFAEHPELEPIFRTLPSEGDAVGVIGLATSAMEGVLTGVIERLNGFGFALPLAKPIVKGEKQAWEGRYESDATGAIQVRISKFERADDARRYILHETLSITDQMKRWETPDSSGIAIGSADGRTILFLSGEFAISARLSYGVEEVLQLVMRMIQRMRL